ncbi:hypothetical protein K439DRAFT_1657660 [Ramaria rubella]|nr:hypothetical protein K439DRAFT_1657660 [Ramaria rubella]
MSFIIQSSSPVRALDGDDSVSITNSSSKLDLPPTKPTAVETVIRSVIKNISRKFGRRDTLRKVTEKKPSCSPKPHLSHSLSEEEIQERLEVLNLIMHGPGRNLPAASGSTDSLPETEFYTPFLAFDELSSGSVAPNDLTLIVPTITIIPPDPDLAIPSPPDQRGRSQQRYDPNVYLSPPPNPLLSIGLGISGSDPISNPCTRPRSERSRVCSDGINLSRNTRSSPVSRAWSAVKQQFSARTLFFAACLLAYVVIPLVFFYFTMVHLPRKVRSKVSRWKQIQ